MLTVWLPIVRAPRVDRISIFAKCETDYENPSACSQKQLAMIVIDRFWHSFEQNQTKHQIDQDRQRWYITDLDVQHAS